MSDVVLCCVTGRIAGDRMGACGDCDPCSAARTIHPAVKALLQERDEFADKYATAEEALTAALARAEKAEKALEKIAGGHGVPDEVLINKQLFGWAQDTARKALAARVLQGEGK